MTAGHVLAYIPSPPQGVWNLGPIPLRAYALCIIVGIIVAVWWSDRRWQARGGQPGDVLDVALIAVPFGLIGGRIYHVITDWWRYFGSDGKGVLAAFEVWDGGLGIWGAVAFGALGGWLGCRWKRIKLPSFGDAIAPAILLAQAIGRLGNYFNQELYGDPTTVPWGLELFNRVDPDTGRHGVSVITGVSDGTVLEVVHPTFLYELVWNLLIVVLLIVVDRVFRIGHGRLFALYVAGYCVGRFGIELMRSDEATHILGLRVNVLVSAVVFLCAALYFVMATKGRETGLSMYWSDRAEQLAAEGEVGYVPPELDDDEFDDEFAEGEPDDGDADFADVDEPYEDEVTELAADGGWSRDAAAFATVGDLPAGAEPEDAEPVEVEPEAVEPLVTEQEVADSEAAELAAAQPEATEPAAAEPERAAPETVEPEATESVATEPEVTEPEAAELEVTEPAATALEAAAPAASEPEVAEPEATEPEATEPEVAESADSALVEHEVDVAESAGDDASTAPGPVSELVEDEVVLTPSEPEPATPSGPGYTVVSDLDGFDIDEITVVESTPGHEVGAMEIRRATDDDA